MNFYEKYIGEIFKDPSNRVFSKDIVDKAIASIDALSIDELEKEFRAFGIDAVRKEDPCEGVSGGGGNSVSKIIFSNTKVQERYFENNKPQPKNSLDFLNACVKVQTERGTEYEGDGQERSFEKMAIIFNTKTGKDLTAAHMALIMQDLKDIRQFSADRYHEDSVLDNVSYSSLKAELLYSQYHK